LGGACAEAARAPLELGQQAALADAGLALDDDRGREAVERLLEPGELALATDQLRRCIHAPILHHG
jgi:hypothetical protein